MSEFVQEANEELAEVIRAEIAHLTEIRQMILEQHSHSFKWLTASLLAINGAAAVATLNTDSIPPVWKVLSGSAFAIGVLCALLVAVLAQKISIKSLVPIQRQIGYWIGVIHDGTRLEEFEAKLGSEMKETMRWGWAIPATGWVSGLFFFAGLGIIAAGLLNDPEPNNNGKADNVNRAVIVGSGDCG